MSAVVNHLAWTCNCTCLKEINTETVTSVNYIVGFDAITAKILHTTCSDVVLRKTGYEFCINAVVCKRYSHIGLTATESGFKLFCLRKTEIARS